MKNKKDLIAQISQNLAEPPPAPAMTSVKAAPTKLAVRAKDGGASKHRPPRQQPEAAEAQDTPRPTGSGKQAAFWLDDEDRAIFHETGMLLYSQGIKPSHNLVLRAAIRMIPRDHRLVEKVRELIEKDGRKVRHQKK